MGLPHTPAIHSPSHAPPPPSPLSQMIGRNGRRVVGGSCSGVSMLSVCGQQTAVDGRLADAGWPVIDSSSCSVLC